MHDVELFRKGGPFGFVKPISVGDFVWRDTDRDGIQDAGEPGIDNVTVTLTRTDGTPVTAPDGTSIATAQLTQHTDPSGAYSFTGLAPGQYTVTVMTPAGFIATMPGMGTPSTDSST